MVQEPDGGNVPYIGSDHGLVRKLWPDASGTLLAWAQFFRRLISGNGAWQFTA